MALSRVHCPVAEMEAIFPEGSGGELFFNVVWVRVSPTSRMGSSAWKLPVANGELPHIDSLYQQDYFVDGAFFQLLTADVFVKAAGEGKTKIVRSLEEIIEGLEIFLGRSSAPHCRTFLAKLVAMPQPPVPPASTSPMATESPSTATGTGPPTGSVLVKIQSALDLARAIKRGLTANGPRAIGTILLASEAEQPSATLLSNASPLPHPSPPTTARAPSSREAGPTRLHKRASSHNLAQPTVKSSRFDQHEENDGARQPATPTMPIPPTLTRMGRSSTSEASLNESPSGFAACGPSKSSSPHSLQVEQKAQDRAVVVDSGHGNDGDGDGDDGDGDDRDGDVDMRDEHSGGRQSLGRGRKPHTLEQARKSLQTRLESAYKTMAAKKFPDHPTSASDLPVLKSSEPCSPRGFKHTVACGMCSSTVVLRCGKLQGILQHWDCCKTVLSRQRPKTGHPGQELKQSSQQQLTLGRFFSPRKHACFIGVAGPSEATVGIFNG